MIFQFRGKFETGVNGCLHCRHQGLICHILWAKGPLGFALAAMLQRSLNYQTVSQAAGWFQKEVSPVAFGSACVDRHQPLCVVLLYSENKCEDLDFYGRRARPPHAHSGCAALLLCWKPPHAGKRKRSLLCFVSEEGGIFWGGGFLTGPGVNGCSC